MFKDELDDIYVNAKAAERDRTGKAERLKSMITDQKATYRVLVFVDTASGRQKRVAEDIESVYHATMICCTNKKVNLGDEAIASRFLNFVISRADCDLFDMLGIKNSLDDQDRQITDDASKMWMVKQSLVAIACALIDGEVLPEPSMDVFDVLNARMLAYLQHQGVNTKEIRGAQMTKRLARVYVILNGLIMLYDRPGAKYENKEFEISQLMDLIPFLYCTKQIALLAITQTSEIYVHPVRMITIKGAFKYCKYPWSPIVSVEDLFKKDSRRVIDWRRHGEGDGIMIDPNYVRLTGSYRDEILTGVSEATDPHVGANEVDVEFAAMTHQFIRVKPFVKIEKRWIDAVPDYDVNVFVLKREDHEQSLQVVIRNYTDNEVYIATEVLLRYKEDLMIEAFAHCIHDGFRPQEFILGTQLRDQHPLFPQKTHIYTGIFQTLIVDRELIQYYSMGPSFYMPDHAYTTPSVRKMILHSRLDPDHADEKYDTRRNKRTKAVEQITQDLDDWGCDKHHYRACVKGLASASIGRQSKVYSTTRQAMMRKRAASRLGGEAMRDIMVDYPLSLKEEANRQIRSQKNARDFDAGAAYREEAHKQEMEAHEAMPFMRRMQTQRPSKFGFQGKFGDKRKRRRPRVIRHVEIVDENVVDDELFESPVLDPSELSRAYIESLATEERARDDASSSGFTSAPRDDDGEDLDSSGRAEKQRKTPSPTGIRMEGFSLTLDGEDTLYGEDDDGEDTLVGGKKVLLSSESNSAHDAVLRALEQQGYE